MGVADLVSAFNYVSAPAFVCRRAVLAYEGRDGIQFQRLTFYGSSAGIGHAFEIRSDQIRPGGDINAAAQATAQRLLDQSRPAPEGQNEGDGSIP